MAEKTKKISLRKCIITNEQLPKKELFRIIKTKDNKIIYDPTGKQNGHGIYLKKDLKIINDARKKLPKIFDMNIDEEIFTSLEKEINK